MMDDEKRAKEKDKVFCIFFDANESNYVTSFSLLFEINGHVCLIPVACITDIAMYIVFVVFKKYELHA